MSERPSLPFLLPAGMRDLLPAEARSRRAVARVVLEHFALWGYEVVTPPAFELAAVLERGLGTLDPRDVLRFVEPESGEVAALRPDMTPQIARMAAARLRDFPPPMRLAYEGTVLRRRQERARRHRQIPQAGLELLGVSGPRGDIEILTLAAESVRRAGVASFVIDLGHAELTRALLAAYPEARANDLRDALAVKDEARVGELAGGVSPRIQAAVTALPALQGGLDVLARGAALFAGTPAEGPLAALRAIVDGCVARGLGEALRVDLGEVRGFAYYTGMHFRVLAEGPGEALGGGGRYDDLLARFGAPMPAAGFALDLDHLAWARRVAGVLEAPPLRILVADDDGEALAAALRARGIAAGLAPRARAKEHAAAWRYAAVLTREGPGWALERLDTGARSCHAESERSDARETLAAWVESLVTGSQEREKTCPPS